MKRMSIWRNCEGVSEIIGTILLLAISVALFSLIFIMVLSESDIVSSPSVNIIGYIDGNSVVLEHHGGDSLSIGTSIQMKIGGNTSTLNVTSPSLHDYNNNGQWDLGEKFTYSTDINGLQVEAIIVDQPSNTALFFGVLQEGNTNTSSISGSISTNVDLIHPYQITSSIKTISATSTGTNPDNIALYYRFSSDNTTWESQVSSIPIVEDFSYARGSYGTSCTINKPSEVQAGDLLVVICTTDGTGSTLSGPSGFSPLISELQIYGQTTASWWKEASGSEPSSYTISWSDSESFVGSCICIRGADTSNPVDSSGNLYYNGNFPVVSPSITTTVDNTLILRFHGMDDEDEGSQYTGYNPYGTTELYAYGSTGSNHECSGACSYESQTTAGPTGTAAWTFLNYEGYAAFTVAIKPATIQTGINWTQWSDGTNPDTNSPWTWSFNFPNSTGYYEFYSIGKKTGLTDETSPSVADAICKYE